MSWNLENAKPGDMIVCIANRADHPKNGEVIGKYLVLAKQSSEANNEYINDYTDLTLHIVYRDFTQSSDLNNPGSTFTIPLEYIDHEVYRWELAYRPEGKEVVQSGVSWEEPEPNENVLLNTTIRDC